VLAGGGIEFTGEVLLRDVAYGPLGSQGYDVSRHLILHLKGGSADGATLDFNFTDPF
jgi:hypothetical protein